MCLPETRKSKCYAGNMQLFRLADEIKYQGNNQADQNAGRDGKKHLKISPVDNNISW